MVSFASPPQDSAHSAPSSPMQSTVDATQDMSTTLSTLSTIQTLYQSIVDLGYAVHYEEGCPLYPDRREDMFYIIRIYAQDGKFFETVPPGLGPVIQRVKVQEGLGVRSYSAEVDEEWMTLARSAAEFIHEESKDGAFKKRWFETSPITGLTAFEQLVLGTGISWYGGHSEDHTRPDLAVLDAQLITPSYEMQPHMEPRIGKERRGDILGKRKKCRSEARKSMKELVKTVQEVKNQGKMLDEELIGGTLRRAELKFQEAYSYWREYPEPVTAIA